jgi:hypothetical protein
MTSIKESLRRLVSGAQPKDDLESNFAYRVFWTSEVRKWEPGRIEKVRNTLQGIFSEGEFDENEVGRKYHLPGVDAQLHSGVSLRELMKVLEAFE